MSGAPRFWSRSPDDPGVLARALSPAAAVWSAAARLRRAAARPVRASVPVVCVGNAVAGGAGKTPTAIALLTLLAEAGVAAHALTRGHGGRETGPHRVDPEADDAARVGDEALLLAAFAPTWVARDRAAGATAAAEAGAEAIVMDDGFQNPGLAKDLSLLIVDAEQGFGNGRVIPAGPLRETPEDALARADAVVLIGADAEAAALRARWPALQGRPIHRARIAPLETGLPLAGTDVVAFAGIGRPEKFFATLRSVGANVVAARAFPDHAAYAPRVLRRLAAEARKSDAMLITTEKDAARLPAWFRREAMALPVRLAFEDADAMRRLIVNVSPEFRRNST